MRRKLALLLALFALAAAMLVGCTGKKLPDGMDADEVTRAGIQVMKQLIDGEYDAVYDLLREDVRAQTSAMDIEAMMAEAENERGSYEKVTDSMATGVTNTDEPHAIAVIRAKYEKKSVYFRIAFDTDMNLIGLEAKGK